MDLVPMSRFSSGHVVFIRNILMSNEGYGTEKFI